MKQKRLLLIVILTIIVNFIFCTNIYADELIIDASEPIIEYILSCHGNQNQYILDKYKDFRNFVDSKIAPDFKVTKEAGIFIAHKE